MFKRTVATLASAAVLAVLVTPSAQAAGPDKLSGYAAGSSATGLAINLIDQSIALASTTAAVSSEGPEEGTAGPTAAADGAALLVAGTPVPSGAPSQTPGGQPSNSVKVVNLDLGDATAGAADGLTAALAQVDTSATVTDGAPSGRSESKQLVINVNGLSGDVLGPIVQPLIAALEDALVQVDEAALCAANDGLLNTLGVCDVVEETTQIDVAALTAEIIANIGELDNGLFTVAQLVVAPSLSTASATADQGVAARGATAGVTVRLFPGVAASIDELVDEVVPDAEVDAPLLTLGLGNAQAEVVRDPVTGKAAPDASAAQLLGIDVTDSLGILSDLLEEDVPGLLDSLAAAGAALSCDGGPLADLVCIDLGAVNELDADELAARGYDFGAGTVGREASAAHIEVLRALGDIVGGESVLSVDLAQASAAANAIPAAPPAAPPAEERESLPRTGGDVNTFVALGLFAAAAAGLAAVRRTRHV